jgi:hypothetical protein
MEDNPRSRSAHLRAAVKIAFDATAEEPDGAPGPSGGAPGPSGEDR